MCKWRNVTPKTNLRPTMKRRRSLTSLREETNTRKQKQNSDTLIYMIVIITAVLSYANSLDGEFVHDDIPSIVTNGDVRGSSPIQQLLLNDFWGTPMVDPNSHKSYRPLTTLSFRLNHALSGLRPWWWHVSNVILHAVCCVLVVRACCTVARLQRPFAALAALLFAVHPVHTEAVAGVVGRADVLACIFFLSSLLMYHRSTSKKRYIWLSVVLGALSMFAKETGITVLVVNLAFDFYRCWPLVRRSITSMRIDRKSTKLSVRTVKVVVSLGVLVCLRLALLQGSWPIFSCQDNPASCHPSFFVRLMTFCYLAAFNLWLLLCPWSLSHDWQMGSVPLITSGWDSRNLLTCVAFGAVLLITKRCLTDLELQRHTPLVVGLLLLVVPFLPASNLVLTVGFVVAERVLYIPSIGYVIIAAYGVQLLWCTKPRCRKLLVLGLAVLASSGFARTWRRNADWRDRGSLLRADLETLPLNAKLHYNFGNLQRETEQQESAIKHYKEALRLWPSYASVHNNLGTLVSSSAEFHFLQAIRFNSHHVNAHYNLGKLYKKSGHLEAAVAMLEKCIFLQPHFVQAHFELLSLKPESERDGILQTLIRLEPENWENYYMYGNWLKDRGLRWAAGRSYLEATRLSFKVKHVQNPVRPDLIAFKSTALMYRATGQKSRTLQLLTRWHTWRRGSASSVAAHMYLREWRLRRELQSKVQLYSSAAKPVKSTKCFDSSQLSLEHPGAPDKKINKETKEPSQRDNNKIYSENRAKDCNCKSYKAKKRVSLTSQIKTTHNKSESGLKNKECPLRKDKSVKSEVMNNIGAPLEHILMKTF